MRRVIASAAVVVALHGGAAGAATVFVNCATGSLNAALAGLDKHTPNTVLVAGLCREFVQVRGFEGLTLRGLPGATLAQPGPIPPARPVASVLEVASVRDVTVEGLRVRAQDAFGISVGWGSSDVRLRNLNLEGGIYGLSIHSNSQAKLARIVGRDPGWAVIGVWDASAVHMEDCLFERTSTADYRVGIHLGEAASLVLHGTTIRDFQEGIRVEPGGMVTVQNISEQPANEPSEVLIESPAGTSFLGMRLSGGMVSLLSKLRITNPGQAWGGETAGVLVEHGGTLLANDNLEISGSRGQGLLATNGAHVSLGGSRITGGAHGGLVAVNGSNVAVALNGGAPAEISGNGTDLFCDTHSLIAGAANIGGATSTACANLLPGASVPLP